MITTDLDPQDYTGFRLNYSPEYGLRFSPFNISYVSLKNEKDHDCEDALALGYASDGSLVLVVGDGVSRTALETYPHPSPAALASNVACKSILDYLTTDYEDDPIARMNKAFAQGNLAVAELNLALGITPETCDYLENDFASCCAAATTLGLDGLLTIATIGDCVIEVIDLSGRKRFVSDNSVAKLEAERSKLSCSKLKQMEIWRGMWRNHPELPNTYGTLTGEPGALPYVTTAQLRLNPGDLVIAHTDGITVTDSPEFNQFLRTGPSPERLAEEIAWYMQMGLIKGPAYKDDKTLIAFQV